MSLPQIIYFLETIIDSNFEKSFYYVCDLCVFYIGYNKFLYNVQMTRHCGIRCAIVGEFCLSDISVGQFVFFYSIDSIGITYYIC